MAYALRETFPAMIRGSNQIQTTLKQYQRITLEGHTGVVQRAGAFNIILKNDQGKTVIIPTRNILDKEIVIEDGPEPEAQERYV